MKSLERVGRFFCVHTHTHARTQDIVDVYTEGMFALNTVNNSQIIHVHIYLFCYVTRNVFGWLKRETENVFYNMDWEFYTYFPLSYYNFYEMKFTISVEAADEYRNVFTFRITHIKTERECLYICSLFRIKSALRYFSYNRWICFT